MDLGFWILKSARRSSELSTPTNFPVVLNEDSNFGMGHLHSPTFLDVIMAQTDVDVTEGLSSLVLNMDLKHHYPKGVFSHPKAFKFGDFQDQKTIQTEVFSCP